MEFLWPTQDLSVSLLISECTYTPGINSSKNYRSVAISSTQLKILDWVIILLDRESLSLNELQFAYQTGSSTTMCTWAALETVDYFLRNGSEVFTCATDMSKAFDMTLHSLMFSKMLDAGVCPLFVRILIFVYAHQEANVRWNGSISSNFTVRNGCGQGRVLAAIAYCLYWGAFCYLKKEAFRMLGWKLLLCYLRLQRRQLGTGTFPLSTSGCLVYPWRIC